MEMSAKVECPKCKHHIDLSVLMARMGNLEMLYLMVRELKLGRTLIYGNYLEQLDRMMESLRIK